MERFPLTDFLSWGCGTKKIPQIRFSQDPGKSKKAKEYLVLQKTAMFFAYLLLFLVSKDPEFTVNKMMLELAVN